MNVVGRLTGSESVGRDNRVLPVTRVVALVIVPILIVASAILWGLPGRTTELFAWTINPEMTAIVMGAGYGTGVYFFARVFREQEWHRVSAVFPGIAVFTWFMAIATALHWGNFNHAHPSFAAWAILYALSPLAIPALWAINERTTPLTVDQESLVLPELVRWTGVITGGAIVAIGTVLFVIPEPLIDHWPWTLSPLTARVLLGWFVLFGIVNAMLGLDARWSRAQIPVQTQIIGFGLMLLGGARFSANFDSSSWTTWAFLGGFLVYVGALCAVYLGMERQSGNGTGA